MKKSTYKTIDIIIFTVIICVFEAVNLIAKKTIFKNELYSLSIVIPLSLIVIMRWKGWGVVPAVLGGAVACLISGAAPIQYLVYCVGNAAVLLCLLWFKWPGQTRVREKLHFTLLYAVSGYIAVNFVRALLALIGGGNFGKLLLGFLAVDALNAAIGLLIIFVARKQKGMFENQNEYLIRLHEEKNKQEGIYG